MSTVTADSVASLEAARDAARHCHPRVAELRRILGASDSTPEERRAAQTELATLRPERLVLREQGAESLAAAQETLSLARRRARAEADTATAAKFRGVSTEALEKRRAELTEQRRAIKRELRAVVIILGERDAEQRTSELIATLSDEQKRALFQRLQAEGIESAERVGVPGSKA